MERKSKGKNLVYYAGTMAFPNSKPLTKKQLEDQAIRDEMVMDATITTPKKVSFVTYEKIVKKSPGYRRFAGVTPRRPKIGR